MKLATREDHAFQARSGAKARREAKERSKVRRAHNGRVAPNGKLDPNGVLPWRLDHAARLAHQFTRPTVPGKSRQMRRLAERRARKAGDA